LTTPITSNKSWCTSLASKRSIRPFS